MPTFRMFPLLLLFTAAFLTVSTSPVTAQTTLQINISLPRDSHQGVAIDTFAREVQQRTKGRYAIQTFYAGQLGAEQASVEAVQRGEQALTFTSTGPVPAFVPEAGILDIPFLFRDYAHARDLLDGPIGQRLLAKFTAKGLVALAWAENGFRHMTNNQRPVNLPADLHGLRLRTMNNPVHISAYRQLGIIPQPIPFTELFAALQQGSVDGQENPLSVITAARFDQVQKYLTLTGHVYSPALILMSTRHWDKLSKADKQAFRDAAAAAVTANRARVDADEAQAVAFLRSKGMTVVEKIDKAQFQAALAPAYAAFGEKFGQENIDRIRTYRSDTARGSSK